MKLRQSLLKYLQSYGGRSLDEECASIIKVIQNRAMRLGAGPDSPLRFQARPLLRSSAKSLALFSILL